MPKANTKKTKLRSHSDACRAIVKMHKDGLSSYSIAKRLNDIGYETSRGRSTWYRETVETVIKRNTADKTEALAVLDYFDGKGTGEASERAGKRFTDAMATTEPTEQRRGLKRMTREGWESLPEPVREAVVERIYKDVVGQ